MAEVLDYWPTQRRAQAERAMDYPWAQWAELDKNGVGDIWLAELGIDFPETTTVERFRYRLYKRAQVVTNTRRRKAIARITENPTAARLYNAGKLDPLTLYKPLKVTVAIISDVQVAFQFYEGDEPPQVINPPRKAVVPTVRRVNRAAKPKPTKERVTSRSRA